jgi:tetratricopeptide (TPR) repeat protein
MEIYSILHKVQLLIKAKDFKKAISLLSSLDSEALKSGDFWYLKGVAEEALNLTMAESSLERAVIISPSNSEFMYRLSKLYMKNQRYEKALIYTSQLVNKLPEHLDVVVNHAQCLLKLSRHNESLLYFGIIKGLQNSSQYFSEVGIAENYVKSYRVKDACLIYKDLFKLHYNSRLIRYNYALVLSKLHKHSCVVELLEEFVSVNVESSVVLLYLSAKEIIDPIELDRVIELLLPEHLNDTLLLKYLCDLYMKQGLELQYILDRIGVSEGLINSFTGYYHLISGNIEQGCNLLSKEALNGNDTFLNELKFYSLTYLPQEAINQAWSILPLSTPATLLIEKKIKQREFKSVIALEESLTNLSIKHVDRECARLSFEALNGVNNRIVNNVNDYLSVKDDVLAADDLCQLKSILDGIHDRECFYQNEQTARNGTQTRGYLFYHDHNVLRKVETMIRKEVELYLLEKKGLEYIEGYCGGEAKISTSFSIRLSKGGHHVSHYHSNGILSGSFYVDIEQSQLENGQGWFNIGALGLPFEKTEPVFYIKPRAGRLVIFPSCWWHGVNLYDSNQKRLTLVFDVIFEKVS